MFASSFLHKVVFLLLLRRSWIQTSFCDCPQYLCSFRILVECNPNRRGQGRILALPKTTSFTSTSQWVNFLFLPNQLIVVHIHRQEQSLFSVAPESWSAHCLVGLHPFFLWLYRHLWERRERCHKVANAIAEDSDREGVHFVYWSREKFARVRKARTLRDGGREQRQLQSTYSAFDTADL